MKSNEIEFAFSLNVSSLEVFQLIALLVLPEYLAKVNQQFYLFTLREFEKNISKVCNDKCFCKAITGTGDNSGITIYEDSPIGLAV